jgi:O-antigen biosynthesis protein
LKGVIHISLSPLSNVSVEGDRFIALSPEPWLGIEADFLLKKAVIKKSVWIELIYSSSYLDEPVRPILRCVLQDNYHDEILPAPVFGRAIWRGYVPAGTVLLQISPTNQVGDFRFQIESLRKISRFELIARAFIKRPRKAVLAIASRLANLRYLARVNIRYAIGATPFADYDAWRKQRIRAFEPNGFDAGILSRVPIVLMCECEVSNKDWVLKFIQELQAQPYEHWNLCIANTEIFEALPKDNRICINVEKNDDALVMNVLVGARLAPYALSVLADAAFNNLKADIFYADSDEITLEGKHHTPRFLPDFDPLLFESQDYLGQAVCVRARVSRDLSWTELRAKLHSMNLPREAYHHVARVVMSLPQGTSFTPIPTFPLSGRGSLSAPKKTSIIIPTKDQPAVFKRCVESIVKFSDMSLVELIIVDNGSSEPDAVAYLKELEVQGFKVLYRPEPFNFSRLCNSGAAIASTDFLVFLNNDTEIMHENWIERLVYFASQPHVGAVGAKLLYEDRRLQHGGVILGLDGRAGHFERLIDEHDAGYFGRLNAPHEIATVTGACLAVEATKFNAIGGFDEVNLPVDLNDIDLCLRLVEKGWACIFASDVVILHHESVSRSGSWRPDEVYSLERTYFKKRWIHELRNCPSFHPALTLEGFRAALG